MTRTGRKPGRRGGPRVLDGRGKGTPMLHGKRLTEFRAHIDGLMAGRTSIHGRKVPL